MINLGDKNWGVKDSGLLAYKQVGSKYFNKDFDFTRASNGTYIDKNGVLQTAEVYNLISYSQDFSGYTNSNSTDEANATISPSGVQNATSFLEAATTGQHKLATSISFDGSSTYTFSIYAKTNGRDLYIDTQNSNEWGGRAWFDLTEGTANSVLGSASIQDVGNGWYRCIVTGTSTLSGGNLIELLTSNGSSNSTTGDTSKGVYIYGAQLVEGTEVRDYQYTNGRVGIPRVDFSDGVGALLLEPQRSNVLLKSNQFDDWGLGSGYTITPNQQGIYGSNDAFLVSKNTDQNYYINQSASITGDYTISIYAKANTADGVFIYTTNAYGGFNLQNGTFISGGGGYTGQSIQSIGNGWYRCSVNGTGPVSSLLVKPVDSNNQNIAGSIYVQHAQIESGSYPTSIIETTTSQVTRIADVANNCGTEQDFNSEEGVLYAEIKRFNGDTSTTTLSINDGSVSNMVSFYYFSTDKVYFDILSSSPNVSGFVAVDDTFSFNKIALKYKSGDIAIWINGQEVLTRTNTISLSGLNELSLSYGDNTALLNGKARSVKYFPTALTDDELQNLTT